MMVALFICGGITVFKKIKWFFSKVDQAKLDDLLNEKY